MMVFKFMQTRHAHKCFHHVRKTQSFSLCPTQIFHSFGQFPHSKCFVVGQFVNARPIVPQIPLINGPTIGVIRVQMSDFVSNWIALCIGGVFHLLKPPSTNQISGVVVHTAATVALQESRRTVLFVAQTHGVFQRIKQCGLVFFFNLFQSFFFLSL